MYDQQSLRSACAYAQSDQSLCLSLDYSMNIKLLTEHHLEFLRFKGRGTGSSESTTLVKMPYCWKSHVTTQYYILANKSTWACTWDNKLDAYLTCTKMPIWVLGLSFTLCMQEGKALARLCICTVWPEP